VDECKPLPGGRFDVASADIIFAKVANGAKARGLYSFPFLINLSLLCPIPLNFSLLCTPCNPK